MVKGTSKQLTDLDDPTNTAPGMIGEIEINLRNETGKKILRLLKDLIKFRKQFVKFTASSTHVYTTDTINKQFISEKKKQPIHYLTTNCCQKSISLSMR
jgi:hypothetical protein